MMKGWCFVFAGEAKPSFNGEEERV